MKFHSIIVTVVLYIDEHERCWLVQYKTQNQSEARKNLTSRYGDYTPYSLRNQNASRFYEFSEYFLLSYQCSETASRQSSSKIHFRKVHLHTHCNLVINKRINIKVFKGK